MSKNIQLFKTFSTLVQLNAEVAHLVEHQLPKLRVAGSSPVFRSVEEAVSKVRYSLFLFGHLMETGSRLGDSQSLRLFLIHPLCT